VLRWFWLVLGHSWQEVYYPTDTRLSGLMLGAWLAAALRDARWRLGLRSLQPWTLWLPVAAMLCLRFQWQDFSVMTWGMSLVEVATAAALFAVRDRSSQLAQMLTRPLLVWLGKLSYGLYLWHYPVFYYLREDCRYRWDDVLLVGGPLSLALAAASWYTVEAWVTRRRGGGLAVRAR
jgi:peptidoglycan/LPS O-acetylase OafA/YrhL